MANGRVSGPVVALSATGEQLAMGPPGPPGAAGSAGAPGPPGPAGDNTLRIVKVQGTSTVDAAPGTTYPVNALNGTPGNVAFTTDQFLTANPNPGAILRVIRQDAGTETCTVAAPTGGSIQDPSTYAYGATASLNTQNQNASWYIDGNVLRLY